MSSVQWIFDFFSFGSLSEKYPELNRVKRAAGCEYVAAPDCVFSDGGKSNPDAVYMAYDAKGLTCRKGQIMLDSTRSKGPVHCCRPSSTSTIDVSKVCANRCAFEGDVPAWPSVHGPGSDLICEEPDLYEIASFSVKNPGTGKSSDMVCCKKIETTTTTKKTTTTAAEKTTTEARKIKRLK